MGGRRAATAPRPGNGTCGIVMVSTTDSLHASNSVRPGKPKRAYLHRRLFEGSVLANNLDRHIQPARLALPAAVHNVVVVVRQPLEKHILGKRRRSLEGRGGGCVR